MAVRTPEEILSGLQSILGDRNDDEAINFATDIRDTLSASPGASEQQIKEAVDAKEAEWRKRYMDTFFNGGGTPPPAGDDTPPDEPKKLTYESLFKEA